MAEPQTLEALDLPLHADQISNDDDADDNDDDDDPNAANSDPQSQSQSQFDRYLHIGCCMHLNAVWME
ncbi:hypothetical protein ACLKA7_000140 [Drosophila subpalustris]